MDEPDRVTAILKALDVPTTIDWYTKLGFRLLDQFPDTEPTWCQLTRDGVCLQFLGGETPWPDPPMFTGTLYVYPESVQGLYEEVRDRLTPAWGPEVREWDARELGFQDPNGYFITFTEPAGYEDGDPTGD